VYERRFKVYERRFKAYEGIFALLTLALVLGLSPSPISTCLFRKLTHSRSENVDRKRTNAAAYISPDAKLRPLVDVHTGIEISGFPETIRSLLELDSMYPLL